MSALQAKQISRSYGGTRALSEVSVELLPGSIHALCGENGAGKSTLIKILSGVETPDSGEVTLNGQPIPLGRVHAVEQIGIVAVHQEPVVFPHLNTVDNLFVGREQSKVGGLWLNKKGMREQACQIMHSLGEAFSLDIPVGQLSLAQRQMVSMGRALLQECRILILDEPTASLSARESRSLFATMDRLQQQGVGILYVSHRLEEVFQLAQQVTILRDGQCAGTQPTSSLSRSELIRMMVGRPVENPSRQQKKTKSKSDKPILKIRGMRRDPVFQDIHLEIHAGEILGLSGLVGAGRSEIARAIFGLDPVDEGEIWFEGRCLPEGFTIQDTMAMGMAMVPEDRQREGLVLPASVEDNLTLPSLIELSGWMGMHRKPRHEASRSLIEQMGIKTASRASSAQSLSGGNQQKIVLGKWVYRQPRLFILDEPTRGVDVGAKEEVHRMIEQLAAGGSAILLISSDMPEILRLSDRILTLCQGRIKGEIASHEATQEILLQWALPEERDALS